MKLILSITVIAATLTAFVVTNQNPPKVPDSKDTTMAQKDKDHQGYNKLTPAEQRVIVHKGTEAPFSGKYYDHKQPGTYICKRCQTPLYRSEDKFDSGCGWPSFDDEIEGAVKRQTDADGMRTEILCANCGAHLGHVFTGEGFTDKNVRHCVNSISMSFIPASAAKPQNQGSETGKQRAYFAGGCFWGVEHWFKKTDAVFSVESGYMGGQTENPTYRQVCSGTTGHAETVEVVYDADKVSFENLARLFFEIHDPTQKNRQGPDVGSQYRSAVFYTNDHQKKLAEELIGRLEEKGYDVATQLEKAQKFWPAEAYHQDYYEKTGKEPYCHLKQQRF